MCIHCSTMLTVISRDPEETRRLAACLAPHLQPGDILALEGDLGAGKTCFVQGLAAALGVRGRAASPTFIVMRRHEGPLPLFHADAYRLSGADELEDAGLDDWISEGVVAIEWADLVAAALPADRLTIRFCGADADRPITFSAFGPRSSALLECLRPCVS